MNPEYMLLQVGQRAPAARDHHALRRVAEETLKSLKWDKFNELALPVNLFERIFLT
jgi:hypothetical protein